MTQTTTCRGHIAYPTLEMAERIAAHHPRNCVKYQSGMRWGPWEHEGHHHLGHLWRTA